MYLSVWRGATGNAFPAQVVAANILLFKSAGNWNADAFQDRSNRSAGSVVVGATNSGDARSANTAWGNTVSLMAPGEFMEVAWTGSNSAVSVQSGTSLATPLAAGVAAAILAANSSLSASQLRTTVLNGASSVAVGNGLGVANRVLYSRINPSNSIVASISGPSLVQPGVSCQYVAVVAGSPGPFTYAWSVNGSPAGTNSATLSYTNSGGFHNIAVLVTAPGATSGSSNVAVSVSGGAPSCGE